MKVGFTGTQQGMTDAQHERLMHILEDLDELGKNGIIEFHHGDCVGADAEAHDIALHLGIAIIRHPPDKDDKRAFCKDSSGDKEPAPYLVRNRDIVNVTQILFATPKTVAEVLRSGTWFTIRYAKSRKKPVWVIRPNGDLVIR